MKRPETVKTKTTYYELIMYPKNTYPEQWNKAKTLAAVYPEQEQAEQIARKIYNSGLYDGIQVREEFVVYRDENNEYSSSGKVFMIGNI